jgi:hypothetical protein
MITCFVVQGFGKKTDFTDGRVLDLDASYAVIKEAVEAAGLVCIRADEIKHAGTIDLPMYQQLLQADLVIADLSTYNVNAAFELGVRYGLRPHATIIVAEEGFKNPFDVGHIVIRRYKHLGEDIGTKEAKRFRDDLKQAIAEIIAEPKTDSPVYTFLQWLSPPREQQDKAVAVELKPAEGATAGTRGSVDFSQKGTDAAPAVQSAKSSLDAALDRIAASDFVAACPLMDEVHKQRPNDSFVVQQLALATYKAKQPNPEAALLKAKKILEELSPATTNDPETLGLWGAIHKRLWDLNHQGADLNESIAAYERGFYVKQDYYNGINLAFLLDLRGLMALKAGQRDEGIADAVQARRIRREVLRYAEQALTRDVTDDKRYWVVATLWEAAAGLDDKVEAQKWQSQARALKVPAWMIDTTERQISSSQATLVEIAQRSAQ